MILNHCTFVKFIRAAASCTHLRKLLTGNRKQLTAHTISSCSFPPGNASLWSDNTRQLYLYLYSVHEVTYKQLQTCIQTTRQAGFMHLSKVQELDVHITGVTGGGSLRATAQQCMQQLLQLLPNLKTLCAGTGCGSQLLLDMSEPPASSVCRAGFVLEPRTGQLMYLPTLLPSPDTLCFWFKERAVDASYLQPLSQLSRLEYLSLNLEKSWGFPDIRQIPSLRHLALRSDAVVSFQSRTDLQQLDSLCLSCTEIWYPEVLAQLKVSSLTLQSVTFQPSESHDTAPGPYWANLKRLYLRGSVSEQLLQALLSPSSAAGGLSVKLQSETFDSFLIEQCFGKKTWPCYSTSYCPELCYVANATPVSGPDYIAAGNITSLELQGDFADDALEQIQTVKVPVRNLSLNVKHESLSLGLINIPSLMELGLWGSLQCSIDSWCDLLSRSPLLAKVKFYGKTDPANIVAAPLQHRCSGKLGIAIAGTTSRNGWKQDSHTCNLIRP